ncbi:hypothetical protein [Streptomyces sp. KL116D]
MQERGGQALAQVLPVVEAERRHGLRGVHALARADPHPVRAQGPDQ